MMFLECIYIRTAVSQMTAGTIADLVNLGQIHFTYRVFTRVFGFVMQNFASGTGNQSLTWMGEDDDYLAFVGADLHHMQVPFIVHAVGGGEDDSRPFQGQGPDRFWPAPVGADHDPKGAEIALENG